MKTTKTAICAALLVVSVSSATAQSVNITPDTAESSFSMNGQTFTVTRNDDTTATLQGDFARTSRACPPDCLQPLVAAQGVTTLGELELLAFLEDRVSGGAGLLLDARSPAEFLTSHIPGAVNVPVATLAPGNTYRNDILRALGAKPLADGTLDFSDALSLAYYSGGVWSDEAPTAIEHLLSAGYPADKLFYYRGGLQAWLLVGLSVITPQNPG